MAKKSQFKIGDNVRIADNEINRVELHRISNRIKIGDKFTLCDVDDNGYCTFSIPGNYLVKAHSSRLEHYYGNMERTWYVDSIHGNDNERDGSCVEPFFSLPYALNMAKSGDSIHLENGYYNIKKPLRSDLNYLGNNVVLIDIDFDGEPYDKNNVSVPGSWEFNHYPLDDVAFQDWTGRCEYWEKYHKRRCD